MPKYQITTRFMDPASNRDAAITKLKRQERERMIESYPTATNVVQQLITDGIPDRVAMGDLRSRGQIAIRTEFEIESTDNQTGGAK